MHDAAYGGQSCAVTEDFIVLKGFLRQHPIADTELTKREDAAVLDNLAARALIDYLLEDAERMCVQEAGDFCSFGDIIIPEAVIKLASEDRRTTISHRLTLDEASTGAKLPFANSPVLKVDGKLMLPDDEDLRRLSKIIRSAWASKNVVSRCSHQDGDL